MPPERSHHGIIIFLVGSSGEQGDQPHKQYFQAPPLGCCIHALAGGKDKRKTRSEMTCFNHSFSAAAIALAPLVSQSRTPTATTSSVQSFTPRVAGSDPRNRGANPSCSLQFCTEIQPRGIASYCKFFTGFISVSHSRTKKKKRKEEEEVRPVACRCSAAMAGSYRRVTIPNKQGLELAGILEEAGKGKGEEEVCILCHGFRSSKDSSTLSSLSKALVEAGMSTFRFDFQGNGESQGEFAYGNYWREVEDLRAVIEYWKTQGRRVETIIGHSKGGNCVVLYASKYHDVPNIVNISGRFSLDAGTNPFDPPPSGSLLNPHVVLQMRT